MINKEWIRDREKYRKYYNQLSHIIDEILDFNTILDIGSANGFFIDYFADKNKEIQGIEIDTRFLPFLSKSSKSNTLFQDVTDIESLNKKYDLVICVEVAEHINKFKSDKLVKFISEHTNKYIYFTAATPYQKGIGHINCESNFFWLNKFRKYNIYIDYDLTEQLITQIDHFSECKWLYYNSLILVKQR